MQKGSEHVHNDIDTTLWEPESGSGGIPEVSIKGTGPA